MSKDDARLDILDQASRLLTDEDQLASGESEEILKLLNVLVEAIERTTDSSEAEKQALWKQHNALQPTRPVIFCSPENSWNEIIPPETLACQHPIARAWEFHLRQQVFWGVEMGDEGLAEFTQLQVVNIARPPVAAKAAA